MERLENERKVIQESLQQSADQVTSQLAEATAQNTELLNKREVCLQTLQLKQQLKTLELINKTRGILEDLTAC